VNRKLLLGQPRATRAHAGTACLFLFPFDVFHHAEGPAIETVYQGHRIRVYPPFSNEPDGQLPHVQVRLECVPRLPNTAPPHVQAPPLHGMRVRANFGNNAVRADALRVDLLGTVGPGTAVSYVDGLLELVRMLTLQWWITRDRRFDETYLRNSFSINELGERLDGVAVQAVTAGQIGVERPLSRAVFEGVVEAAAGGKRSPMSLSMVCDCFYFFVGRDLRRFVVEAAIACETVLTEHARQHAASLGVTRGLIKRELEKAHFQDRLDRGCKRVFGRSFSEDQPDAAGWLQALWIGRNHVAHGKALVIRHSGRSLTPGHTEYVAMVQAVVSLFEWITQFSPYRPI
jgi:hypothetical protein